MQVGPADVPPDASSSYEQENWRERDRKESQLEVNEVVLTKPRNRRAEVEATLAALSRLSAWMHNTKRWQIYEDLTLHQATAIHHVVTTDGMTAGNLATMMQGSPATVSALLNRLQNAGYVRRQLAEDDRRQVQLIATDKARAAHPAILERIVSEAEKTFSNWSLADLRNFNGCLDRLIQDAVPPGQD